MVDPITGIDLEKAGIADIVNRQNVGASQRARNELIRQQTQSGKSPDLSSLYSTQQQTQTDSGIMPFEDWKKSLELRDRPIHQPYSIGGPQLPVQYETSQEPSIRNYLKYAMPNEPKLDSFGYYGTGFFGRPNNMTPQDYWRGRTDLPQEVINAIYAPGDAIRHANDPTIKQLNEKYKYVAPASESQLGSPDGGGFDWRSNPYGSFDLGKDDWYLTPKYIRGSNEVFGDVNREDATKYKPYNEDGSFNPNGWETRQRKSGALGGLLGTLGILTSAFGPTMFGPVEGTAGTLGSENMFFGGLDAMAPQVTQSAGMFGNKAWDLGNKYVNKAAEGALKGFLFSGGNPTAALQGGLTGPVGGYISDVANPYIGNIASKALGGAASGTLASLFTKNSPIAGSLYGGMSGGLNAYLNSVNANSDPFNKTLANTISGLTRKKLFRNK